jgi:hypothetical protein
MLAVWEENPKVFAFDECGLTPEPWNIQFFGRLPSQDPKELQIALKAATGCGKSAVLAVAALWHLTVHGGKDATRHPQGVVASIDEANLRSGIWRELAVWLSHSEFLKAAFEQTATRLSAKQHSATWFIEARTWAKRADADEQGRALSGIHSPYLLAILDEAGDMPVALLRVAQQIFSSQHEWAKILISGNPTSISGVLYEAAVNQAGSTHVISISADPDDSRRGKRTDIENAKRQIARYGRSNPWVMATILGQFPPSAMNALLGVAEVETAMKRHYEKRAYSWSEKRLGVDVARFGDDRTVLAPRQGQKWFAPVELRGVRTNVIAARIIQAVNRWEPRDPTSIRIMIDQTGGWGQGTVDQLIVSGYSPQDLVYSTPSPDPRYYNLRSYMYFMMAEHIRSSAAIPDIDATKTLRAELTASTYTLRDGKLAVEPKELIKSKLGYSPDLADGFAMTYALPDMPRRPSFVAQRAEKVLTDWEPAAAGGKVSSWDWEPGE